MSFLAHRGERGFIALGREASLVWRKENLQRDRGGWTIGPTKRSKAIFTNSHGLWGIPKPFEMGNY